MLLVGLQRRDVAAVISFKPWYVNRFCGLFGVPQKEGYGGTLLLVGTVVAKYRDGGERCSEYHFIYRDDSFIYRDGCFIYRDDSFIYHDGARAFASLLISCIYSNVGYIGPFDDGKVNPSLHGLLWNQFFRISGCQVVWIDDVTWTRRLHLWGVVSAGARFVSSAYLFRIF